jgi:hypothetical protein
MLVCFLSPEQVLLLNGHLEILKNHDHVGAILRKKKMNGDLKKVGYFH